MKFARQSTAVARKGYKTNVDLKENGDTQQSTQPFHASLLIFPVEWGVCFRRIEVQHIVRDPHTKRDLARTLTVRGAEGLGLPRPIDDCVLIGLKALTLEAKFASPRIEFSRYELCRTFGWKTDGATYKRLTRSLDRLVATTLKFEDSWWDKGEKEWTSKTFNLLSNVELCSLDRYTRTRRKIKQAYRPLSSFTWNDVVWKSFQDGNIRTLDMEMFRRVSNGHRREVPTRLFRWLAKHFYRGPYVSFDVMKLCIGTLGVSVRFPSEAKRALERAGRLLVDCGVLESFRFRIGKTGRHEVIFKKYVARKIPVTKIAVKPSGSENSDGMNQWLSSCTDEELQLAEDRLLETERGGKFELETIRQARKNGQCIRSSGRIRLEILKRFMDSEPQTESVTTNQPSSGDGAHSAEYNRSASRIAT